MHKTSSSITMASSNSSMLTFSSSFFIFFIMISIYYKNCLATSQTQTFTYSQTLNHFGIGGIFGNSTFQQRYIVDATYWAGPENNGPFLVVLGGEAPIKTAVGKIGVVTEAALRLGAIVVYIEHRFYGTSVPYGSIDTAFLSPEIRSYLSTEQALADFAEIILSLKANLSAANSPVIVLGCSYAGMLAAWFRLKFPHITIGALASSAPILFYENIAPENDFCSIVTKDFEHVNRKCSDIIRQSWRIIDEIASQPNGLGRLTRAFNFCSSLPSSYELKALLVHIYSFAAQYNGRYNFWINSICDPIVEASNDNILEGVARAVYIVNNESCIDMNFTGFAPPFQLLDINSQKAWNWQICSELVPNRSCNGDNSILPRELFDSQAQYMEYCQKTYSASPRPYWVQKYYGGKDIRAGSNIIFSNGLMDPYSTAGILDDISDTIVTIKTEERSHCLDINYAREDDPKWLTHQRKTEIKIFEKWINGGVQTMTLCRKTAFFLALSLILVLSE